MNFILEGQKTLSSDNLALLYAAITKKERESGIERAKLLNKIISTHGLSEFLSPSLSNPKEKMNKKFGKRPRSNDTNEHDAKILKLFY